THSPPSLPPSPAPRSHSHRRCRPQPCPPLFPYTTLFRSCLPRLEEARLPSRHLGLYTAAEIDNLSGRLNALADALEANASLDRLLDLCRRPAPEAAAEALPPVRAKIAVARDAAFCFCYPESLDALRAAGAECVFFSPLKDAALPAVGGLYLPGGYPELYAGALSQ